MQSKTTNGLCIHTLNFLVERLEKQLFEMQPQGQLPNGDMAIPDYSDREYLMLDSVKADIEQLLEIEVKAQAEYFHNMDMEGLYGPQK